LLHVGGGRRLLQPPDARQTDAARRRHRRVCVTRRHSGVRRDGHAPRHQRGAHRYAARDCEQADQRVYRTAVRHLSPGALQPARDGRAGAGGRDRRLVHELLRGVSNENRLHVAVDVRAGGDARVRRALEHGRADAAYGRRVAIDVVGRHGPMTRRALVVGGIALVVWATLAYATGGVSGSWFGISLSARIVVRPLILAMSLLVCAAFSSGWRPIDADIEWLAAALRPTLTPAIAAAAAAVLLLGIVRGIDTAAGADSYGYLSQADLWLRGN